MPDPKKRGGVSMNEDEENEISGRGTMAEHGRNTQFTSDQARAEGALNGEAPTPPVEDASQIDNPVPGRGAGGSPVNDRDAALPDDIPDGLTESRAHRKLGADAVREGDIDTAALAAERERRNREDR